MPNRTKRKAPVRLENKVAIVTGAARGIGQAIAIRFAKEGASLVIDYVGDPSQAVDTARQIADAGGKSISVAADVSKPDQVQDLIDSAVKAYGKLDIVINNAGVEKKIAFVDYPLEELQEDSRHQSRWTFSGLSGRRTPNDPAGQWRTPNQYFVDSRGSSDADKRGLLCE